MIDVWQNLAGQDTAKRAIEVAMVSGLPITFVACEGLEYLFTPYDVAKLPPEPREKMQAHMDKYDGAPMSAAAAADVVTQVQEIAVALADRCGLPVLNTHTDFAAMRIDILPTSIADLLIPPPAESVDAVVGRVLAAIEKLPYMTDDMSPEAKALLDKWREMVPGAPVDAAIEMARNIAALGGYVSREVLSSERPRIGRMCLAEAISYCHR